MFKFLGRIKKRTLAFVAVVPLLAITSIATAPCPVCNGTGSLATTPGMANVEILDYDTWEWRITRDACGLFILYFYDINLTMFNPDPEPVDGWIKLTMVDNTHEERRPVIDTQYRPVDLSASSITDLSYTVVFGTGTDAWGTTEIWIEAVEGDVPDVVCKGTGRVPSNTWMFVNGLKDTFLEHVRVEAEYRPPQVIDWEDYEFFDE